MGGLYQGNILVLLEKEIKRLRNMPQALENIPHLIFLLFYRTEKQNLEMVNTVFITIRI